MNEMNRKLIEKMEEGRLVFGTLATSGSDCGFVFQGASNLLGQFKDGFGKED